MVSLPVQYISLIAKQHHNAKFSGQLYYANYKSKFLSLQSAHLKSRYNFNKCRNCHKINRPCCNSFLFTSKKTNNACRTNSIRQRLQPDDCFYSNILPPCTIQKQGNKRKYFSFYATGFCLYYSGILLI